MTGLNTYFTADYHINHGGIIGFCSRPFTSVGKMAAEIINRHNEVVRPDDELWNIGDVCMMSAKHAFKIKDMITRMKGAKHLVLGNHDDWRPRVYQGVGFTTVHTAFWFDYGDHTFYLMHDPAEYTVIQNDPKAIMLCGHVHQVFQHLLPEKRVINVGVDVWDYRPVSFEQILSLLDEHGVTIRGG